MVEAGGYLLFGLQGLRQQVSWRSGSRQGVEDLREVSNDDTVVAQRWLKDKKPEEKKNTDCFVKEQEKEYHIVWKIKMGNVFDFCNQRSTQQCMKSGVTKHFGVTGIQQQNGLVDETNLTLIAKFVNASTYRSSGTLSSFVVALLVIVHQLLYLLVLQLVLSFQ
ncbi:zinc finger, CCHC-type containing protein [Tanacetum coccineum]